MLNSTLKGCPQYEQKPKTLHGIPEELVQFRKHQLDNPTCLHSKSSGKCKLSSVAVWGKTFRECLLITTIKLNKAKFSNEATTQHTLSSRQTEIRSLKGFFCRQMFRLSSTFSQELDDAVPHSHWHQRSDCFDAFSNSDQQLLSINSITVSLKDRTSIRLHPGRSSTRFAKSLAKNSLSLCTFRVVVERSAMSFHLSAHRTCRLRVSEAPSESANPHH